MRGYLDPRVSASRISVKTQVRGMLCEVPACEAKRHCQKGKNLLVCHTKGNCVILAEARKAIKIGCPSTGESTSIEAV